MRSRWIQASMVMMCLAVVTRAHAGAIPPFDPPTPQSVLYVDDDAPAGGDGASWNTAFQDIQSALDTIFAGVPLPAEVRLAQGTYEPTAVAPEGGTRFLLSDNVSLLGSFGGIGAPNPNEQDFESTPTIISRNAIDAIAPIIEFGDFGPSGATYLGGLHLNDVGRGFLANGDDRVFVDSCRIECSDVDIDIDFDASVHLSNCTIGNGVNCEPFVSCNSARFTATNTHFDGFRSGFQNSQFNGLIQHLNCEAHYSNCVFSQHSNGSRFSGGTATYSSCTFTECETAIEMRNSQPTSPDITIIDCTFQSNETGLNNAINLGFFDNTPRLTVQNSTFTNNERAFDVGAIRESISFTDCTFTANAPFGAGRFQLFGGLEPSMIGTFTRCDFISNDHIEDSPFDPRGGAIEIVASSSQASENEIILNTYVRMSDCTFTSNESQTGGALSFRTSTSTPDDFTWRGPALIIEQCSFNQNTAEISGSAIDINVPVAFGQPNVGLISAAFNPDGCVLVDTCSFNGNTAPDNSAVIVSPDGNVLFRGVNTATGTQTIRNSGHLSSGNENTPFDEAMIPFEYIPNGVSTFSSIAGTLRTGVIGNPDFNIQDRLRFGRPLTFGGGLLVDFVGGQIPPGGSSYRIIDILDGATGLFDTTFITGLPPNRQAVIQYSLDSDAGGGGLQEPGVDVLIIDLDDPLAFQDPTSFGLPGVPSDTALLDANLDGFIDLAAIVPGVPSVFVLLNNGTETDNWLGFEVNPVIEVALGSVPLAVSAGNLDNALGDDIAISTMNDRIQTLLSIGSGQYLLDQSLPLASAALDLIIDEFTGDGEDDIATLSNTTITIVNEDEERIEVAVTAIRVYPNDGTGTLAPAVSSFISETPGTSLAAADFDTDNTVDIAFAFDRPATDEEDGIAILTNSGGGQMSLVAVRNTGEDPGDIEPSDLDEDKDVDIVALDTNGIVVIENEFIDATTALNGPQGGQFSPTVSLTLENSPTSIAAVDLDNDGDRDLAVTLVNTVGDSGVRVFRNDLNAGQLIFAEAGELAAGSNPVLVLSADVDGDESADLITVNSTLPAASPPLVHGGREGSGSTVPPALGPSEFGSIDVLINMSEAVPLSCPADCAPLGGNGTVNVDDLITVINNFGQAGQCDVTPANPDGTFGNGIINVDDLIAVINAFGDCG